LPTFDQSLELADLPIPPVGAGEIRVRVRAASVNGFDLAVAHGYLRDRMEHRFPVVLGKDFSGIVDARGEGVANFREGDRVFGVVAQSFLGNGSFGEFVVVSAGVGVATLPEAIGFTEGAALGLAGAAAADSVSAASINASSTVLISGAMGGVGQQAVQLARAVGAVVIATAKTEEDAENLKALGATHTVDHSGDVVRQIRGIYPDGLDAVLHFAGDVEQLSSLVKPGGIVVSTIALDLPQELPGGVRTARIMAQATQATLEKIANDYVEGRTTVAIEQIFSLDKAQDGLAKFASGKRGKLVVSVSAD
jgi:NADPH2:quinone reductase